MPADPDSYDAAVGLVRSHTHVSLVQYLRKNPGAYVSDILDGTDIPRGSLGRALRELVELNILTIDVQPEKRGTGRNYRYTVNTTHVRDLLSVLRTELLGSPN